MINLVHHKEEEYDFITCIKNRIKNNLNFLAIATGPTGIGKSWSLLSMGYELDPEFEVRQVAFSFKQVMQILNSDWFHKKKYKVLIFEEAQVTISNRAWQSLSNRLFNYLISTFRHRNVIFLISSPYADFLDKQSHKLLHVEFKIKGHDKRTSETIIRPLFLEWNARQKEFYYHSLYVQIGSNRHKLKWWHLSKPPKHLIKAYEEVKTEFTNSLNKDIMKELENMGKESKDNEIIKPLTKMQSLVNNLDEEGHTPKEISKKLDISTSAVSQHKKAINKKRKGT